MDLHQAQLNEGDGIPQESRYALTNDQDGRV